VLGEGRTAMMFLSEPPREGEPDGATAARIERTACISAACGFLSEKRPRNVCIAQALPDPSDGWALEAYAASGFLKVGELSYLRRPTAGLSAARGLVELPVGDELIAFDALIEKVGKAKADEMMVEALDRSYEQTLDCPELCGLRATSDVLESHRATGQFDPRLWWLLLSAGEISGCLLLNPCPEQSTVELVYVGLARAVRGRQLGRRVLEYGLARACANRAHWEVACAVDDRNTGAKKLYDSLGFKPAARRVALVHPV